MRVGGLVGLESDEGAIGSRLERVYSLELNNVLLKTIIIYTDRHPHAQPASRRLLYRPRSSSEFPEDAEVSLALVSLGCRETLSFRVRLCG